MNNEFLRPQKESIVRRVQNYFRRSHAERDAADVPLPLTTQSPVIETLRAMQPAEEAAAKFVVPPASEKLSRDQLSSCYRDILEIFEKLGCGVSQRNGSPLYGRYVEESDRSLFDRLRQLADILTIGPNGKCGVTGIFEAPFENLVGRQLPGDLIREMNYMFYDIEKKNLAMLHPNTLNALEAWFQSLDSELPRIHGMPQVSSKRPPTGEVFVRGLAAGAGTLVVPTIDGRHVLPSSNVVADTKINSLNRLHLPGNGAANAKELADSVNVLEPKAIVFSDNWPAGEPEAFVGRLTGNWRGKDLEGMLFFERD